MRTTVLLSLPREGLTLVGGRVLHHDEHVIRVRRHCIITPAPPAPVWAQSAVTYHP
jgi:hypothetical protein